MSAAIAIDCSGTTLEGTGLTRFVPGVGSAGQNCIRIAVKNAGGVPVPVKLHWIDCHFARVGGSGGGAMGGAGDAMADGEPGYVVNACLVTNGIVDINYCVDDYTCPNISINIKIKGTPVTPAPIVVPMMIGYNGGNSFVRSYPIAAAQPHTGLAVSYDEKTMIVACAPRLPTGASAVGLHVYNLPEGRKVAQLDMPASFKPMKCKFAWQSNTNILAIDAENGRLMEVNIRGEQVRDFLDGGSRDMCCLAVAGDMIAVGRKVKSGKQVTILSYSTGAVLAAWSTGMNKIPDAPQIDALAFTPDHKHLVCVDNQARAYVSTIGGAFVKNIAPGCMTMSITNDGCREVTVLPNGQVVLLDAGANRIVLLDEAGNEARAWGGPGAEHGKFMGPASFVCRGAHLYVLENGPRVDRVQVFA